MELETLKTSRCFRGDTSLVLQKRDMEIIRCCYEQQFLMYEQIERFYFSSAHTQNARARISKLKRAGLLRSEVPIGLTSQHLLRVTETGRRLAKELSPFDVPQAKKVDPATLIHDRIVTDVRLRLCQLWDGVWVPEKALKDKYTRIPDGLFQFDTGTAFAIEIENSLKGRARFLSILNEWQRTEGIKVVLFVATTPKIFVAIESLLKGAPSKPVLGVVLWEELRTGAPIVKCRGNDLDLFSVRTI